MKKVFSLIIIILICVNGKKAYALAETAKSACLLNAVTGNVVFEKESDMKLPMASTTKIMTLLTALLNSQPEELVTVPKEAIMQEGSSAYLREGAVITMNDLMYGLMLNSGNDAAIAVAHHISGGTVAFAAEMNTLANRIGASDTFFKNPSGLDEDGHYTTAYDLALITKYALKNDKFREIVSTKLYKASYIQTDKTVFELEYINHNKLLGRLDGCIGVKTGYTKADGRCLVSAAERNGAVYIAVTLDAPNDWEEHKEMLEYAFARSRTKRVISCGDVIKRAKCGREYSNLVVARDFDIPLDSGENMACELKVNLPPEITFSLNAGEKVGELHIYNDGNFLDTVDIVAETEFTAGIKTEVERSFVLSALTILRMLL